MGERSVTPAVVALLCLGLLVATACADDDLVEVDGNGEPGTDEPTTTGADADDERTPTSTPQPVADLHGPLGSMGAALLRRDVARVVVEIDRSEGRELRDGSTSALRAELERSGGKAVELGGADVLPTQDVWSSAQLRQLGADHRASGAGPGHVSIQVLVVSGRHEDDGVVGIALDASTFAVFPDRLEGGLLGGLSPGEIERAVVLHELGHLFGLVNLTGQGAFHEDPDHPGHADSDESVMFWAVERDIVTQIFDGGPPTEFDEADREEMARIRG